MTVELIVWQLDTQSPQSGYRGKEIVAYESADAEGVFEAVRAWATVRGWTTTVTAIDDMANLTIKTPPEAGWHVCIHKAHQLYMLVRWPTAPAAIKAL